MKSTGRLGKSISNNIETLRAEMTSNQAELKIAMNEMQFKLDTLTARVNEAEERISDLQDKLMEKKAVEENRDRLLVPHEKRIAEINDAMKRSNFRNIRIPKGWRERDRRYI